MASAEYIYGALRGIFCIYKPPGKSMQNIVQMIRGNLSRDLNALPCRPVRQMVKIGEQSPGSELPIITTVPDLADHPLVVGTRYVEDDFDVTFGDALSREASGVSVVGLGSPAWLRNLVSARYIRVYHLKAELGRATDDFSDQGRLIERTTYHHVTPAKIDKVIAAMQAGHQKHMFSSAGLDLETQEAYEMAAQGLIRPKTREAGPVIYGFKCIDLSPPHFTLEVHAVNETTDYLRKLVHELGLEMKASAVCTQVRRIRYGNFLLQHALLYKHWTAQNIVDNIKLCRALAEGTRHEHRAQIKSRHNESSPTMLQPLPDF